MLLLGVLGRLRRLLSFPSSSSVAPCVRVSSCAVSPFAGPSGHRRSPLPHSIHVLVHLRLPVTLVLVPMHGGSRRRVRLSRLVVPLLQGRLPGAGGGGGGSASPDGEHRGSHSRLT